MEMTVINRFEGDVAVLLVGDERRVIDVPREFLLAGRRRGCG
jgi:hypothetical protein